MKLKHRTKTRRGGGGGGAGEEGHIRRKLLFLTSPTPAHTRSSKMTIVHVSMENLVMNRLISYYSLRFRKLSSFLLLVPMRDVEGQGLWLIDVVKLFTQNVG